MPPRVDLSSQDFFRDPAAAIARLRTAGPLVEIAFPIVGRVWITTTHALAERVLQDSRIFTLRKDGIVVLRAQKLDVLDIDRLAGEAGVELDRESSPPAADRRAVGFPGWARVQGEHVLACA